MKPKASSKKAFDVKDFKDLAFSGLAPHISMKPKASSKKKEFAFKALKALHTIIPEAPIILNII